MEHLLAQAPRDRRSTTFAHPFFFWGALLALVLSVVFVAGFGYLGIGRDGEFARNLAYFVTAGDLWGQGISPYAYEVFAKGASVVPGFNPESTFAYAPTIALPSILLSYLPLWLAAALNGLVNILSTLFLCWFALRLSFGEGRIEWRSTQSFVICAVIIGNPLAAHAIWLGQTTLIAAVVTALAFIWAGKGRFILAGIALGLASVKPQVSLLVGLWLLMEKHYRVILVAALTSLVLSAPAFWVSGITLPQEWLHALASYKTGVHDEITFRHVFGLRSLFADHGILLPDLLVPTILLTGGFFYLRDRLRRDDVLGLLFLFSSGFIYAHDYDLAASMIAIGSFWYLLRGQPVQGLIALAMLAYLCFPQRIVLHFLPDIGHYREPVFFVLLFWLVWLMLKASKNDQRANDPLVD